uniref:Uncharacterized protein LOC101295056 n=1 Tax=Rhizophora mucronata TaxID=61149 RepID=A0A2P2MVX0_RHIMU
MKMEILIPSFSLKSCSSNGEMVGSILPLKRQLLKGDRILVLNILHGLRSLMLSSYVVKLCSCIF